MKTNNEAQIANEHPYDVAGKKLATILLRNMLGRMDNPSYYGLAPGVALACLSDHLTRHMDKDLGSDKPHLWQALSRWAKIELHDMGNVMANNPASCGLLFSPNGVFSKPEWQRHLTNLFGMDAPQCYEFWRNEVKKAYAVTPGE